MANTDFDTHDTAAHEVNIGGALSTEIEEPFWEHLLDVLVTVFNQSKAASQTLIDTLRERLEDAPKETQVFFFNQNPLQVAKDMLGREGPLSAEEKRRYSKLLDRFRREEDRQHPLIEEAINKLIPDDFLA
ncbi:hypothetical protein ACK9YZ_12570 [Rhizobium sp. ZK1]|uniref:hypothetical protein n=1 Tax=Rhizobium sp. ZK1 TaxID=3389872 RepID=UPI0039F73770